MATEHALGPSIGTYQDRDIPAWGEWYGKRFVYDRIAVLDADGLFDLATLVKGECVIFPGLIYRRKTP